MTWLWQNLDLVFGLAVDHIRLSAVPIVVSLVASIPLGWLASRSRVLRSILLGVGGLLFTIPSLALFLVLPVILGTRILDEINVVVALTIYGVAVMVRGAADAFAAVPDDVVNSSTAVGFSPFDLFRSVELPLAGPVLLASLRVVSVSTVSLLSVGSLIGVTTLGRLFLDGYQRNFPEEIVIGIAFTILVAVLFDRVLVVAGLLLMPWTRAQSRSSSRAPITVGTRTLGEGAGVGR
jgi:osmoprotectant transport system permease protein